MHPLALTQSDVLKLVPAVRDGCSSWLEPRAGCLCAGSGNSLAFSDLSGQDLRKNKYTKADLRGVDMRCAARQAAARRSLPVSADSWHHCRAVPTHWHAHHSTPALPPPLPAAAPTWRASRCLARWPPTPSLWVPTCGLLTWS